MKKYKCKQCFCRGSSPLSIVHKMDCSNSYEIRRLAFDLEDKKIDEHTYLNKLAHLVVS